VDDLIVHEATRRALGLSSEEYQALNEGKESTESYPPSNRQPMPRLEATELLKHAYAGSCAILGIYNNLERTLHVAVTGDSRAVLGRRVLVPAKHASRRKGGYESIIGKR
jgi:pyruvate dehydrogenase phosphatase